MSQRILRVRELLKREIGSIISQDYGFNALVTVNDVDVTPDLRNGHVFIGVIGSDQEKVNVVNTLNKERGMIQKKISKRVVMKFTPKLHFKSDESIERGVRTLNIIDSLDPINYEDSDESLNANSDD
ncbi:MAG: 30S ribosome-binding factor RbfA [Akkermansiaceae bacterium]|jgi:ribosome-binding factor A|nr:30S ribosome-binding factor RbfA [Akkermansiaceae bacterium]MDG1854672.1 30S ribosome-binding factor RbfA [Verrucomicrobiales bacterium]